MMRLLPPKVVWHTFGTSGAVRNTWFHTAATAPELSGEMTTVPVIERPIFFPSGVVA